jgi:UPF0716 protein FxsA
MTRLLPLLMLAGLGAELASIIMVGNALGLVPTLLLILAGGVLGVSLIRSAGTSLAVALRSPVQASSLQKGIAGKAMARAVAGLLFLVPGFFSDLAGLLLLMPPVRQWLGSRLPVKGVSTSKTAYRHGETIIDAEAIEVRGELQQPEPGQGRGRDNAGDR